MSYQIYDTRNDYFVLGEFDSYEDANEHRGKLLKKVEYSQFHTRIDMPILLNCEDSIPYVTLYANEKQFWRKLLSINNIVESDEDAGDKISQIKNIMLRWS